MHTSLILEKVESNMLFFSVFTTDVSPIETSVMGRYCGQLQLHIERGREFLEDLSSLYMIAYRDSVPKTDIPVWVKELS